MLSKLHGGWVISLLLTPWLAACGGPILPLPTAESPEAASVTSTSDHPTPVRPTPLPPEVWETELWCETPFISREIPPEEYDWAVFVLENIEPGTTTLREVVELLGEPALPNPEYHQLGYDPFLDHVGGSVIIAYSRERVNWMGVWRPMTLGQLIEMYGVPSRVFREASDGDPTGEWLGITSLRYDERRIEAVIQRGLCEFPPDIPVDSLYVHGRGGWNPPSANAVEIEWPGLTAEETD